jgi:hypothetical protein
MVQVESYMCGKWCAATPPSPSVETLGVHDTAAIFSRHWETRIIDIDSSVILEARQRGERVFLDLRSRSTQSGTHDILWLRRSP